MYTFIKIEQIELLIFIQNILKTFIFIELEISPLILHVQADGAQRNILNMPVIRSISSR